MIQSMTGFAEKRFESRSLSVKMSIRSLNHRFFDWSFRGNHSKELEERFRRLCIKSLQRGRIEVTVDVDFSDPEKLEMRVNEAVLAKILSAFEKISSPMVKNVTLNVENLFDLPYVIQLRRKKFSKEETNFLEECFEKTLMEIIGGRTKEGRQLKAEILSHVRRVDRTVKQVEILSARQPELIQKKLSERLKELGQQIDVPEEKLACEAAFIAQKYDLTEEIARLKCHLDHFLELLRSDRKDPVGKNLDFLSQEMFREANTINSKAQDLRIVKKGLAIKGEVEMIRQQVQNLE